MDLFKTALAIILGATVAALFVLALLGIATAFVGA